MVETNAFIFILSLVLMITFMICKKSTKSSLPPSPPSLPIIGHLHLLKVKQPLHESLLNLSHIYGPVMLIRFGVQRAVIVTSPSTVQECFTKTNDIALANRPLTPSFKHISYNHTTMSFAPYGHLWRALRRVAASELLSTVGLDATTRLREHEIKLTCKQIVNESNLDKLINLKSRFRDLLYNLTTMTIMGKRFYGHDLDNICEALVFREMMEELFKLIHTKNVGDFLPVLGWLGVGGVDKKMISLTKRVDKFLNEVIDERRRIGSCESKIMVDKLLTLQQQEPELYTDQMIKGFILEMLVVGTETPYLALEWSMSLILNNPNAMETIKNEITTHVGSDCLLRENDLGKLRYLQNVINESLRLYPTLPLLIPREASEDITICGYFVPRGTMLMVNAHAIQRDNVLWDEPDKFMPERFDNDRMGTDLDKYKMLAFGVGRRGCPGTNLGYRVLGLALGTLIQVFEWEKIGTEKEIDMTAFYGLSMAKLKPLQAFCKPRSSMIAHIL